MLNTYIIRLKDNNLSCTLALDAEMAAKKCDAQVEYFDGIDSVQSLDFFAERQININRNFAQEPPGTWGCLASHMSLWERCVEQQVPITILEHDGIMLRNPEEIVRGVHEYCHLDGFIPLDNTIPLDSEAQFLLYDQQVKDFTPGIHQELKFKSIIGATYDLTGFFYVGAYGYIITPVGASKLLNFVDYLGAIPADQVMCEKAVTLQRTKGTYVRLHPFYKSKFIQINYSTRR